MKRICILLLLIIFTTNVFSQEYLYILNDSCITNLITLAETSFQHTKITTNRDSRGILLRFELKNPIEEYKNLSYETYQNSLRIKDFLSKIENPAIIEVHTESVLQNQIKTPRNWELSTVIANKIENVVLTKSNKNLRNRIKSIGYGEFLPSKNTSNNGGNFSNRVDIIILCNISGE